MFEERSKKKIDELYEKNLHDEGHAFITELLHNGVSHDLELYLLTMREKLDKKARGHRKPPFEVSGVLLDYFVSPEKLWKLKLPTEEIDAKDLLWHLDVPFFWSEPDGFYDLTPRQVMANPALSARDNEKMNNADMTYPIDITWHKDKWLILDGLHRFMKAVDLNREVINVRKVPKAQLELIKR